MENTLTTLLTAGVLSALISGLISFRQQSVFFIEQDNRLKEKEKQDDIKKSEFIKKAFLFEAKYNILLVEKAEREMHRLEEHYFDTQCFKLFKEDIALLDVGMVNMIISLYLELIQTNARIEELNHARINYDSIKPKYLNQRDGLLSFVRYLETGSLI